MVQSRVRYDEEAGGTAALYWVPGAFRRRASQVSKRWRLTSIQEREAEYHDDVRDDVRAEDRVHPPLVEHRSVDHVVALLKQKH